MAAPVHIEGLSPIHESVLAFVQKQVTDRKLAMCSTLEIGSYNVNGSVRSFFHGPYLGIDLVAGPGVDFVVESGKSLPFNDHSFKVIVSTEMLEHDPRPWQTLREMARLIEPGGTLLLTCRGFDETGAFQFHNPPDRWRFSRDAMRILAEDAGFEVELLERDPQVVGWFLLASTA